MGGLLHNLFHISHYIGDVVDNILEKLLLVFRNAILHPSPFFGCPLLTFDAFLGDSIVIVCSFLIKFYHRSFDTIWNFSWFLWFNLTLVMNYFISFEVWHSFFELIEVYHESFDLIWALPWFFNIEFDLLSQVIWFNLRFATIFLI